MGEKYENDPIWYEERISRLLAENTELKRISGILEDTMENHCCDDNIGIIVDENLSGTLRELRLKSRISELEGALKFYRDNCDCCRHINFEGADSEGGKDECS